MSTIDPGPTRHTNPDPLAPGQPPRRTHGARRWLVTVVAAVTVIGGATAAGAYWSSRNNTPAAQGGTSGSAESVTAPSQASVSATSPATSTSAATSSAVGAERAIPVYYLADVAGGPRLYREFHSLAVLNGTPALTAVTEMLRGTPVDPDYSSPWPKTVSVRSLTVSGNLAIVDLTGFVALGAVYEVASVQQLVYTVTAAEPSVQQVRLLVNGAVAPSGHMDWSAPISRANALDTQANVWILAPTQGATVTSPVTVSVLGTGWEGNVPLQFYMGQRLVAATHVTTMMGGFAQAQTTIQLPPGSYELRAYNDNGRDSSLQLWDTKTFTVR
jgi:spore germination protein GerM